MADNIFARWTETSSMTPKLMRSNNDEPQGPNIGLAFSGGGVRATVFHLGVLARLARQDLFQNVRVISSVSGGSLAVGLVFAAAGNRWPQSDQYLHAVVPKCLHTLTTKNVQRQYVINSLLRPWQLISGRASVLGDTLSSQWGIHGHLSDLPESPRWFINATCYQTGKNWRFQRDLMGDYQTKYVVNPSFRLAHALATSAAVPGLIGPKVIRAHDHQWSEHGKEGWKSISPKYKQLHLWDGGVYDNLGVESLFKPGEGLRSGTDFLIVSDASRQLSIAKRQSRWSPDYVKASIRLVDIATDQVRSLRARMLIEHFQRNPGTGTYLRLGLGTNKIFARKEIPGQPSLSQYEIDQAARMETTLRRLTPEEFSLLFRHGFEVADVRLSTHGNACFEQQPRNQIRFRAA